MAALSVIYSNFCGMVVSETRNGVESDYVSVTLGSTIGLLNSAGIMTDRWEYWPYGEVVSRTGTSVTPLTFLGVLGYFQDVLSKLSYVRARHLRVDLARWLTLDPVWPNASAFSYANGAPSRNVDYSGRFPCALPLIPCAACAIDISIVCPPGMENWGQCVVGVWNELPTWTQILCGVACAAFFGCIGIQIIGGVASLLAETIGPTLVLQAPVFTIVGLCTALALEKCSIFRDLPGASEECIADYFSACMHGVPIDL